MPARLDDDFFISEYYERREKNTSAVHCPCAGVVALTKKL